MRYSVSPFLTVCVTAVPATTDTAQLAPAMSSATRTIFFAIELIFLIIMSHPFAMRSFWKNTTTSDI
jgi:hypothetical protein